MVAKGVLVRKCKLPEKSDYNLEDKRDCSLIIEPKIFENPNVESTPTGYQVLKLEDFEIKNNQEPKNIPLETKNSSNPLDTVNNILYNTETKQNPDKKEVSNSMSENTKSYVSGGTTPNSTIIINKPKPNYLTIGIIGLIGVCVIYKIFIKNK